MSKLTASIVIFNPNVKRVLETIDSLFSDYPQVELTIVDNSPIKSNFTENLSPNYKGQIIYLWNGKNLGFGAAHNLAVKHISPPSDYHLIINPDITVQEGCIRELTSYLDQNPEVGMVGPKILSPDGSMQYSCKRNPSLFILAIRWLVKRSVIESIDLLRMKNSLYEMQDFNYNSSIEPEFLSGCFMIIRRKIFEQLDGFDDRYFLYLEDADLTRRVNQVSKTKFIPTATVIHDWMRGSHKNIKLALIMFQSAIKYFSKWGLKII